MKKRQFRETYYPGEVLAFDPRAMFMAFAMSPEPVVDCIEGVGILKICGPLEKDPGGSFLSYESIVSAFSGLLCDDEVECVVIKIDSPGGEVDGLNEAVKEMLLLKEQHGKPVCAFANELAASAAYALACVADDIYLPESGGVGSIGVIATMHEQTKKDAKEGNTFELITSGARKGDGNPHVEISDGARARMERRVDQLAAMFFELVAAHRPLTPAKVEALEADVFYGQDAVKRGLADGVLSFPELMNRLAGAQATSVSTSNYSPSSGRGTSMSMDKLMKARAEALEAFQAAKTEAHKARTGLAYRDACVALALEEAKLEAKKMKKTKYVEETYKDDSDDGDDDSDGDDDKSDEDSKKAEDADEKKAEDADEKKSKKAEDADEKKAESEEDEKKAMKSQIAQLKSERDRELAALREELDALKSEKAEAELDEIIKRGRAEGKVSAKEVSSLKKAARTLGSEWLASNLKERAPIVRQDEQLPKAFTGVDGLSAEQAKIAEKLGATIEQAKAAAAASKGMLR